MDLKCHLENGDEIAEAKRKCLSSGELFSKSNFFLEKLLSYT